MIAPVEINLPSGLRIVMYARPPRYKWWPFMKLDDGETEQELFKRFAEAVRSVDFHAVANLYDPPYQLGHQNVLSKPKTDTTVATREVLGELLPGLNELFGGPKARKPRKKKEAALFDQPVAPHEND